MAVLEPEPIEVGGETPAVLWPAEDPVGSAFVLPGGSRAGHRLGGTPARPDLHYTRSLLLRHELSVLELWWDAESAPTAEEGEAWLLEQARAASSASPAPVRLAVARSWGTRALAKLVGMGQAPEAMLWIAPLNRHDEVRSALAAAAPVSIVVAGSADELVDLDQLRSLEPAGAQLVLVEGGSHALEVGDPATNARRLADVLDALDDAVAGTVAGATR